MQFCRNEEPTIKVVSRNEKTISIAIFDSDLQKV